MADDLQITGALGTVIFDELDPPKGQQFNQFLAYLTKAPIVTAGYGGWSRVSRPRKRAITEWVGRDSVSITMECLIDTFIENDGLWTEGMCRYLETLAGVDFGDPEPPLFQLKSKPEALMPHGFHRASHVKWFVESITWDADSVIYNSVGNRVRAGCVIVVTQYAADSRLEALSPSKRYRSNRNSGSKKGSKGAKTKTYKVKRGDTLSRIAARKDAYGDASQWHRIAEANNIRDPKKLSIGQVLKIP